MMKNSLIIAFTITIMHEIEIELYWKLSKTVSNTYWFVLDVNEYKCLINFKLHDNKSIYCTDEGDMHFHKTHFYKRRLYNNRLLYNISWNYDDNWIIIKLIAMPWYIYIIHLIKSESIYSRTPIWVHVISWE